MRQIQVLVPDDRLGPVTGMLDEEGFDYVRQPAWRDGEEQWLLEFPVPSDAIGYVRRELEDVGVTTEEYTTITSLEGATTPRVESLQERFADDFDPLTTAELRSKARDLSRDTRSFLVMIALSSVIAVAGLLIGSAAVVVGSMVIAPIVGPVLTAAVGAVTTDREMLVHSVWIQATGLAVAIAAAGAFAYGLQLAGYFPPSLDVNSIDLIALRVAPNLVTLAIGLAAGAAGAYGLTTKGPTSLIGVMIAAALIPAAATVGIAAAWGEYRVATGSLLLLLLTMTLINVAAYAVLQRYYRPDREGWLLPSDRSGRVAVVGTAIALVVLVTVVGSASYQQIAFERTVNAEIQDTLADPEYDDLGLISVRIQYIGGSFGSPETVTVYLSRPAAGGDPPAVATAFERRISDAADRQIDVRVRFREYQRADGDAG